MSDASGKGSRVRTRWEKVEAARDRELLEWVARFRFVTVAATADRLEVAVVNARKRLQHLEAAGLLASSRQGGSAAIFYIANAGRQLLGLPWRAPPRGELQRDHELAIVEQVTRFERAAAPGVRVMTERECRRAETEGAGRFHVSVRGEGPRGLSERWPDIVIVDAQDRRVAVELEFSVKHTARLARIVDGFLRSREYAQVIYVVNNVPLARRLVGLIDDGTARRSRGATSQMFRSHSTAMSVVPWDGADEATRRGIEAAVAGTRPSARAA